MRGSLVDLDTSPEALAVQTELYRRMGAPRRLATMYRLNAMVRSLAMAGIRQRHPAYTEDQVKWAYQRLILGDELIRRVYPQRELIAP